MMYVPDLWPFSEHIISPLMAALMTKESGWRSILVLWCRFSEGKNEVVRLGSLDYAVKIPENGFLVWENASAGD